MVTREKAFSKTVVIDVLWAMILFMQEDRRWSDVSAL